MENTWFKFEKIMFWLKLKTSIMGNSTNICFCHKHAVLVGLYWRSGMNPCSEKMSTVPIENYCQVFLKIPGSELSCALKRWHNFQIIQFFSVPLHNSIQIWKSHSLKWCFGPLNKMEPESLTCSQPACHSLLWTPLLHYVSHTASMYCASCVLRTPPV